MTNSQSLDCLFFRDVCGNPMLFHSIPPRLWIHYCSGYLCFVYYLLLSHSVAISVSRYLSQQHSYASKKPLCYLLISLKHEQWHQKFYLNNFVLMLVIIIINILLRPVCELNFIIGRSVKKKIVYISYIHCGISMYSPINNW